MDPYILPKYSHAISRSRSWAKHSLLSQTVPGKENNLGFTKIFKGLEQEQNYLTELP